ncbi:MAG: carbohydrate ABC transporter permease, partial [Chloroflexi bacterium]
MILPRTAEGVNPARVWSQAQVKLGLNLRQGSKQLLYDATGVAVAAIMLFPIYWMVATAFKPGRDILTLTPKWIPAPFTLENFRDAITRPYFVDDVRNSLIVVGVMLILALTIAFLAAVSVARFGF